VSRDAADCDDLFSISHIDDVTIAIAGEIDSVTSTTLRAALAIPTIRRVDMSAVTFFDSAGIHAIVDARRTRPGSDLRIVEPSQVVQRVLELTGLTALVTGRCTSRHDEFPAAPSPEPT
jgi:stage II sporulation protein AA (anti-sigma F factor antagonist)